MNTSNACTEQSRSMISFDWAMKRLLRNKANFEVLEGFLSELLRRKIIIKYIGESEGNRSGKDDKTNRVDMLVEVDEKELVIIELQYFHEDEYFHRMLYGVSKAITDHISKGQMYQNVRKVFSINIVHFDLGAGDVVVEQVEREYEHPPRSWHTPRPTLRPLLIMPSETATLRRLSKREKWMVGGVLGMVAVIAAFLVISFTSSGPTSRNGCIYATVPGAVGAQQIHECGATARATCQSVHVAYTPQAAQTIAVACRKAGLPVGSG